MSFVRGKAACPQWEQSKCPSSSDGCIQECLDVFFDWKFMETKNVLTSTIEPTFQKQSAYFAFL